MTKALTSIAELQINDSNIKIDFTLTIDDEDISSYLISSNLSYSIEFGSASATFTLNNDDGRFGEGGSSKIEIGDVVSYKEKFEGDSNEYSKFYGIVNQRAISKSADAKNITLVCLDYISTLQFLDIDLEVEGTKVEVTNETLTPNYLADPNDSLAQVFDFANDSLADDPAPIIIIRNKNTAVDDPQYDGFEVHSSQGQLKLGTPLNAKDNYDLICTSYYFYTAGVYAEDIIEDVLIEEDGYGGFLFGETTAQAVIDNHLTETYLNVEGSSTDTLESNLTYSTITIKTTLSSAVVAGAISISVVSTSGFPTSGQGSINGDIFTWTGKTATTLTGIPSTGSYSLKAHASTSYVEYEHEYDPGQVWYFDYSHILTTLTISDFVIPGGTFSYFDARYGRIILETAISTSASVKCNTNYSFNTLQATGIEINKLKFKPRELENRFEAIKKIRSYLAPNYIIRTKGDTKIWASYLSQKTTEDYTLELHTSINYLEDEDLYTRVVFYGKNKNPTNLMFSDGVDFITTGETYKSIATNSELMPLKEEGNYYIYGSTLSSIGKITANTIKPIVYINSIPINNTSQLVAAQQVMIEQTVRSEQTVSSNGK